MREWRLIIDPPLNGWENMAIDEAIFSACGSGEGPSTIRFYGWIQPTLTIGHFQGVGPDVRRCLALGIPVVRRITGGKAVLHDKELTYSVICRHDEPLFGKGILWAYRVISSFFISALREIEVKAELRVEGHGLKVDRNGFSCFHTYSRFEVMVDGRKLMGSAQKRTREAFLQHGSIPFDMDEGRFRQVFGEGSLEGVAWVHLYTNIGMDRFRAMVIREMEKGLGIQLRMGELTPLEVSLRGRLLKDRSGQGFSVR